MVWTLFFQEETKPSYWLTLHKEYTIGRKDTDIVILQDPSISRLHATLNPKHDHVEFIDKSKFGSILNTTQKVTPNAVIALKDGDKVTLGAATSLTLRKEAMEVYCAVPYAEDLAPLLQDVGATVCPSPVDCTHICTEELVPSASIVCGLCRNIPIVHKGYFQRLLTRSSPKFLPPDAFAMLPSIHPSWKDIPIDVSTPEPFRPRSQRGEVLCGKTLLFIDQGLYSEVHLLAPFLKCKCILDTSLVMNGGKGMESSESVTAFGVRHQTDIIIVDDSMSVEEGMSDEQIRMIEVNMNVYDLLSRLGLSCYTYQSFIGTIVYGDITNLFPYTPRATTIPPISKKQTTSEPPKEQHRPKGDNQDTRRPYYQIPPRAPGEGPQAPLVKIVVTPITTRHANISPSQQRNNPPPPQGFKHFQKQALYKAEGVSGDVRDPHPILQVDLVGDDLVVNVSSQIDTRSAMRRQAMYKAVPMITSRNLTSMSDAHMAASRPQATSKKSSKQKRERSSSPQRAEKPRSKLSPSKSKKATSEGDVVPATSRAVAAEQSKSTNAVKRPLDIFDIDYEFVH